MFLEVEVAAQGLKEWVPSESVPGTPTPSCETWIEQLSPRLSLPQAPTWVEPPSPRLTPRSSSAGYTTNASPPVKKSPACILAMGCANPPNKFDQATYADWYFNVTKSSGKVQLKQKMQRICDRSGIQNRYSILKEEFLKQHPEFCTPGEPSLEQRNAITSLLRLSQLWLSRIPGCRCHADQAGVTALRIAQDLAENNPSSRILICCSELVARTFRAPNEKFPYDLVRTALFGDGASAAVVGAQPQPQIERPLYQIEWVGEVLAPDSENIEGTLKLEGLQFYLDRTLPSLVSKHVGGFCRAALDNAPEKPGFNDIFWAVHSGGPAILNAVEAALELHPEKLSASHHILKHFGNISASTQSDCEWGIAVAFGPGVTIEVALLKRCK
ncbi:hypothetical protein KP509_10G063200 [Ceratopteris richardii]|uniref:Chalcone synthase n=1 Tax=Ceratopteris richardii TaxID=49495 RepID=A0A8T2U2P6_CERRI|nr:hypothetical protein KP509_10G063200 [Ceratopteris richardii]